MENKNLLRVPKIKCDRVLSHDDLTLYYPNCVLIRKEDMDKIDFDNLPNGYRLSDFFYHNGNLYLNK